MAHQMSNGLPESRRSSATDCAFYHGRADCRQPAAQYGPPQCHQEPFYARGVNALPLNLNIPPGAAVLSPGPGLWSGTTTEHDAYSGGSPETPACYSDVDPDQNFYASQHIHTPVIHEHDWSERFQEIPLPVGGSVAQGLGIAPKETLNDPALSYDSYQSIPATLRASESSAFLSDLPPPSLFRPDAQRIIDPGYCFDAPQSGYPLEAVITDEEDNESMGGNTTDRDNDYHPSGTPSNGIVTYSKATSKSRPFSKTPKRSQRTKGNKTSPAVTQGRITKRSAPKPNTTLPSARRSTKPTPSTLATASTTNHPHLCPHCSSTFSAPSSLTKHTLSKHSRPFTCIFSPYGCASIFGSKNEWARHVRVQHLHLELWRCDLGKCGVENAANARAGKAITHDFDRKDLFTQHARRMHRDVFPALEGDRARCEIALQRDAHIVLRHPPQRSECTFCDEKGVFGNWEARMEHVGKHLEQGDAERVIEKEDLELKRWMMDHHLLVSDQMGGYRLAGCDGKRGRGSKKVMKQVRVQVINEEEEEDEDEGEREGESDDEGDVDAEGEDDADFQHP